MHANTRSLRRFNTHTYTHSGKHTHDALRHIIILSVWRTLESRAARERLQQHFRMHALYTARLRAITHTRAHKHWTHTRRQRRWRPRGSLFCWFRLLFDGSSPCVVSRQVRVRVCLKGGDGPLGSTHTHDGENAQRLR